MAKRKKKKKAKAARKGKARDMLVVGSKVKAYVRGKGFMASGELLGALNESVYAMLDSALARTEANKRSTARPQDL